MNESLEPVVEECFENLWKALKLIVWYDHYPMHSDYYQYKEASEDLSLGIPAELRKDFLKYVKKKTGHLSNYSGD